MALVTRTISSTANLSTEIGNCGANTDILYLNAGTYSTGLTRTVDSTTRTRYLTITPTPGLTRDDVIIQSASAAESVFNQVDWIRLQNLTFQPALPGGANLFCLHLITPNRWIIQGCKFVSPTGAAGAINIDPKSTTGDKRRVAANVWIDGCEFTSADQTTVANFCVRAVFMGSALTQGFCENVHLVNNKFHHLTSPVSWGVCQNIHVEGNEFYECRYDGVRHPDCIKANGDACHLYIRKNNFHDNTAEQIMLKDGVLQNVVVENNVVATPGSSFQCIKIYDSRNVRLVNNTCGRAILFSRINFACQDVVCFNNTAGTLDCDTNINQVPEFTFKDYNVYTTNPIYLTRAANETAGTASYVNSGATPPDYHLTAGDTTAANQGVASGGGYLAPVTDLDGNARPFGAAHDRGAYERQT